MPILKKFSKSISERRRQDVNDAQIEELKEKIEQQNELIKELALKAGYSIELMAETESGSKIFEFTKNEEDSMGGSYTNPTEWFSGMQIIAGEDDYVNTGWYVYEGLVQRCILNGNPDSFEDPIYWEIM